MGPYYVCTSAGGWIGEEGKQEIVSYTRLTGGLDKMDWIRKEMVREIHGRNGEEVFLLGQGKSGGKTHLELRKQFLEN